MNEKRVAISRLFFIVKRGRKWYNRGMIKKIDEEQFDEAYEIMRESFPLEEYRPYEEQKALLQKPCYTLYGFGEGEIAGLLAVYEWADMRFIEHFAIKPTLRGQGIGGRALQVLLTLSPKPTYLEVELPDTPLARRRIAFYERNGFALNGYPYVQPSISAGRREVPLRIMSYGGRIGEEEFLRFQRRVYTQVYGCVKKI